MYLQNLFPEKKYLKLWPGWSKQNALRMSQTACENENMSLRGGFASSSLFYSDVKSRQHIEKGEKMNKIDVLIIGGGAAGLVAATTGKSHYPDKSFLLVRMEKHVLVPCGIPYIFGSLKNSDQNILPDAMLTKAGVPIKIG